MGGICCTQGNRYVEVLRVFECSLFLQLIGADSTQAIIRHAQVRKAEGEVHRPSAIPAQTGQLTVIFDGCIGLFDANGKNTLNIRAFMPLGRAQTVAQHAPNNYALQDSEVLLTTEIFLFWKSDKEVVCRYVSEGSGDEVVLQSTVCSRVEWRSQARYLLLPAQALPDATEGRKDSSLNALTNTDFIGLLGTIPFFANLPKDKLAVLTEMSTIRVYPSNSVIFREDEGISTQLFVTLAGSVEVTSSRATGPLAKLEAGSFFGEMSLLINIPRAATVRALESCMLMSIEKKAFHTLLDQCPDVRLSIHKLLKERLLLKAILSGVLPFFDSVPSERMIRFSHELDIEDQVHKGDIVLRQHDEDEAQDSKFVFLVYGALEILSNQRKTSKFGHDNTVFLTPGCYVGPFTFERMNIRKAKVLARSAAVLLTCPFSKVVELFKEYPAAGAAANIAWFGERCDFVSVLRHGVLTQRFQAFLESEHSDENFLFFLDIEKFRVIEADNERREFSVYIRERYIQSDAPKEVNLPAGIRDGVLEKMDKLSPTDIIEVSFFDESLDEITRLMVKDSFPRFKKSMHFQNVVDMLDPHTNRKGSRLVAACHHFRDSLQVLRPGHVDMKHMQLERMMSTIQKSHARKKNPSGPTIPQ
ncbi:Regulator of G-protein signaling 21 [Phytophthora citrophthora]|uniref:Regulator of G-protein signaling 21 n=1 Tax=Phytophthora citrophthora TaxID=4793 RepID=A0AAD9GWY0_9STRA|nr:Regulator of G-protein signaling 21 [Phytophthora citrophthora]